MPNASHCEVLLGPFLSFVTVNGQLGPANGYPSYILRLQGSSDLCVGAYVTPNGSVAASTATSFTGQGTVRPASAGHSWL